MEEIDAKHRAAEDRASEQLAQKIVRNQQLVGQKVIEAGPKAAAVKEHYAELKKAR